MIGKIVFLPFKLLGGVIGVFFKIVKGGVSFLCGTFRLVISRFLAAIFGALIGFFLGRGHIGIRLFKKRKRSWNRGRFRKRSFPEPNLLLFTSWGKIQLWGMWLLNLP